MMSTPASLDRFTALMAGLAAATGRGGACVRFRKQALELAGRGLPVLTQALAEVDPDSAALVERQAAAARTSWLIWPGAPRLRDANALLEAVRRFDETFATAGPESLPDAGALAEADGDPIALARATLTAVAAADPSGFWAAPGSATARGVLTDAAAFALRQMLEPAALAQQLAAAFAGAFGERRSAPALVEGGAPSRSELDALMAALGQSDRASEAEAAGLSYAAVVEAARPIAAALPNCSRAVVELERAIDLMIEARRAASAAEGLPASRPAGVGDPAPAVQEARARLGAGDFARAAEIVEAALRRRGPEAGASAETLRLHDLGVAAAVLRRDADAVARLDASRARLTARGGAALFGALRACFVAWWSRGCRVGLPFDLEVAAAVAGFWAAEAEGGAERGRALHNRAMALAERATLHAQPGLLELAVAAFRDALAARPRAGGATEWALTAHGLGKALTELGQRGGGAAALREAVEALRGALEVRRRDDAPADWAASQLALAAALHALGETEGGSARLLEAVTAYREGLAEISPTRASATWAKAQHDLGDALTALGQRMQGPARLREAAAAYGAALSAIDPERAPFDWALSAGAQGVTLGLLASGGSDPEGAALAIDRIRAARDAMRRAGDHAYAAHFDAQLAAARGLQARLGEF